MVLRPFLILLFVHFIQRLALSITRWNVVSFEQKIKQFSVGLANDIFISCAVALVPLLFSVGLKLRHQKLGKHPSPRTIQWISYLSAALFISLMLLLLSNFINVLYTGNNITPYDFGYLKDAVVLADSITAQVNFKNMPPFSAVLFSILLFTYFFKKSTLAQLKRGSSAFAGALFLIVLGTGARSYSLSARVILYEPVETHILPYLSWRHKIDSQHFTFFPKDGFTSLKKHLQDRFVNVHDSRRFVFERNFTSTSSQKEMVGKLPPNSNVVIILLESFGSEILQNNPEVAPFFESLKNRSLVLPKHFTNSFRTCGAQFTTLCSLFDPPEFYVSRDYPRKKVKCLPQIFQEFDYSTLMVSGTPKGFDYNAEWFLNNGFEKVVTGEDYSKTVARSSYGVHDEYTFARLLNELNALQEPFFSYALTISNHHPYELPSGFENKYPFIKKWGSVEKTFFYTDKSLEQFFVAAEKEPWFHNTLFLIFGDHEPWGFEGGGHHEDANFHRTRLRYQTSALFYHPKLKPIMWANETSHLNLAPTILSLLNRSATSHLLGPSIFEEHQLPFIISQENQRPSPFVTHDMHKAVFTNSDLGGCSVVEALEPRTRRSCTPEELNRNGWVKKTFYETLRWFVTNH